MLSSISICPPLVAHMSPPNTLSRALHPVCFPPRPHSQSLTPSSRAFVSKLRKVSVTRTGFRREAKVRSRTLVTSSFSGAASGNGAAPDDAKSKLLTAIEGTDRGIFGLKSAKRKELEELVNALAQQNPTPEPTADLSKVAGEWRLLYTTIQILGRSRTKLGLRNFVKLGDFIQRIDIEESRAYNEVAFHVSGLGTINGKLTVQAQYKVESPTRVDIDYEESTLVPDQLEVLFQKNFDLLLKLFNPQGWLEIAYLDDQHRIGYDDKGNIFVLEKI